MFLIQFYFVDLEIIFFSFSFLDAIDMFCRFDFDYYVYVQAYYGSVTFGYSCLKGWT